MKVFLEQNRWLTKPGKDATNPDYYRDINESNSFSNLFDQEMLDQITHYLLESTLLETKSIRISISQNRN